LEKCYIITWLFFQIRPENSTQRLGNNVDYHGMATIYRLYETIYRLFGKVPCCHRALFPNERSEKSIRTLGHNLDYYGVATMFMLYEMSRLFWKNAILLQGSFSK